MDKLPVDREKLSDIFDMLNQYVSLLSIYQEQNYQEIREVLDMKQYILTLLSSTASQMAVGGWVPSRQPQDSQSPLPPGSRVNYGPQTSTEKG
jgi:hypothetical protein